MTVTAFEIVGEGLCHPVPSGPPKLWTEIGWKSLTFISGFSYNPYDFFVMLAARSGLLLLRPTAGETYCWRTQLSSLSTQLA